MNFYAVTQLRYDDTVFGHFWIFSIFMLIIDIIANGLIRAYKYGEFGIVSYKNSSDKVLN